MPTSLYLYSEIDEEWGYTPCNDQGTPTDGDYHLWEAMACLTDDEVHDIIDDLYILAIVVDCGTVHGIRFEWVEADDNYGFERLTA